MAHYTSRISQLILDQLAVGERRVLSLIVAVGKVPRSETSKGDLTAMVKSELRRLVVAGAIVEADGLYSLSPTKWTAETR
jgi:hypothetical protein